ncbi:MAG: hypothetical protein H8D23_38580 [Candidatus Brocadiales bacterium]|nr:hypothetical protein [Candidatus Brocadiales bacterium]
MTLTEQDKKDVLRVIKDCSDSLTRMEGEREFIKEAIIGLHAKYEMDKSHLRKVVNIYYKQNLAEVQAQNTEVEDLYETLTS